MLDEVQAQNGVGYFHVGRFIHGYGHWEGGFSQGELFWRVNVMWAIAIVAFIASIVVIYVVLPCY